MSLARVLFLGFVCIAAFITAGMMQLGAAVTVSDELLDAISCVESNKNICAIGDNGRSIGPYQIMRAYFNDSVSYLIATQGTSNIGNSYNFMQASTKYACINDIATISHVKSMHTHDDQLIFLYNWVDDYSNVVSIHTLIIIIIILQTTGGILSLLCGHKNSVRCTFYLANGTLN